MNNNYIEKGSRAFWQVSLTLFLGGFITFALLYGIQPMMPLFSQEFNITAAESSLVLSVAATTLAFGLLLTGPLSDTYGRKGIMVIALLATSFFTIVSAITPNWTMLLISRALVGLSLSGLVAIGMTYLSEEISPNNLGVAIGIYIAGNALGGMCGRMITGFVIDYVHWQIILGVMGAQVLLAAGCFWYFLPSSKHFHSTPLQLNKLFHGYIHHLTSPKLPWLFLLGFLLMGGFVTLLNYITYYLLAPPYLLSQAIIGLFSFVYLAGMFSSTQFGLLADKKGQSKVLWIAISIMLLGILITLIHHPIIIFLGMLVLTFGFFGAHSVISSWIGRLAQQARGQASSLYLFCYYMGSSILGTAGGLAWTNYNWQGVVAFISGLFIISLAIALWIKKSTINH